MSGLHLLASCAALPLGRMQVGTDGRWKPVPRDENVDQLTVYLLHPTTGTVYFDDVTLSVVRDTAKPCTRDPISGRESCNAGKPVTP